MDPVTTLINVYKDQTAVLYNVWSIFQGLSMVLIGYVLTQEYLRKNPSVLAVISTGIFLFSLGNRFAIERAQRLVSAAAEQLRALADTHGALAPTLSQFMAPRTEDLLLAHAVLTAFLTLGPWVPFIVNRLAERSNKSRSTAE